LIESINIDWQQNQAHMNGDGQNSQSLPELFRRFDVRNRQNAPCASLGIRTSADIFEAAQKEARPERDISSRESRGAMADSFRRLDVGSRSNATLGERYLLLSRLHSRGYRMIIVRNVERYRCGGSVSVPSGR
jgi:hypothetical protein